MPALPYYTIPYLQDENIDIILFSDLAQISQIHGIIDQRILVFELQLYNLSLRDSEKYNN